MSIHTEIRDQNPLPPLDSQAGLEARLLRLLELTLAEEQRSRSAADESLRPLSAAQLRRNAMAELMLHAEDGYFDHMNSLVRRSAVYTASILVFALCTLLLNQGQFYSVPGQTQILVQSGAPATLHIRSISDFSCD
jgi:hypothetical protein